ncbi:uncharacterized protein [Atheta coriaria]|uniref:uncharacterized protein n=1 Tax=Dalotia coriaria TaxID=877792 RepID=UPI0031F385E9
MEKLIFTTLFFGLFISSTSSVKIRTFYVPGKAGNEAPLLCTYDLESDTLYDVKWYKDGEQFFRCEPNGVTTAFDVDGVKVQHIKFAPLGSCSLTLMLLTQKTAGEYKCEVNTEGPKFDTASETKKLMIIEPSRKRTHGTHNTSATATITNNSVVQYHQTRENEISYDAASHLRFDVLLYAFCLFALYTH